MYPDSSRIPRLAERIGLYAQLAHERGARGTGPLLRRAERALAAAARALERLPVDRRLQRREPDGLAAIRLRRPPGPRRLRVALAPDYPERLAGALLARMAGCTLGAPVEGWSVERMEHLARENGEAFPPTDYWTAVPFPHEKRYEVSPRSAYTRRGMDGVPVDDDLVYTLLGLLILEDHGPDFTVEDVGAAWLAYLPYACTAEEVALANLKAGVPASRAATRDNPFVEWIGADIRADPWGYLAPGWPERAAEMAWRDAWVSHRRNGIYGEMFFAAAVAAAFAVDDPMEALEIGLSEIPRECSLARAVRWALKVAPRIRDYRAARAAVDRRFAGMSSVHTINNACLTIFGLAIGGRDVGRVIGETVAMGLDNDCTAATAGSVVGAVVGRRGVDRRWYRPFGDTVRSYLIGKPRWSIRGLLARFERQARRVAASRQ